MKAYDICIITAANEHQAIGYRKQLEWRSGRGLLPAETEFFIMADPLGKRIGSGGSTIYVLYKILEHLTKVRTTKLPYHANSSSHKTFTSPVEPFKGKRILILHSGGDSRRLPAYSTVGKLFFPLPTSFSPLSKHVKTNGFVCLFDILLHNLMYLPCLSHGQIVLASGDVLLTLDPSEVAFSDSGLTGLAYPGPVEVASNHGVYVAHQTLQGERISEVVDFLQKPDHDELKNAKALDAANRAFVDTGIMNFSIDSVGVLMDASGISMSNGSVVTESGSLCERLINAELELDIYREVPLAILGKLDPVTLKTTETAASLDHSSIELLQQIPFSVCLLSHCEFFHVGTSRKLIQNLLAISYTASVYNFKNLSKTKIIDGSALNGAFIYNSLVETTALRSNGQAIVEGCYLQGNIDLDGENILTGIPKGAGDIYMRKGICATYIPVEKAGPDKKTHGWVLIIYGVEDDFKKRAGDATFLNVALSDWMERKGITSADLWYDNDPQDLWNARFFAFSNDPAESGRISLRLQVEHAARLLELDNSDGSSSNKRAACSTDQEWRESVRMSLCDILQSVDYSRFLDNYSNLHREINLENLTTIIKQESNLSSREVLSWCSDNNDYTTEAKRTLALIGESRDILLRARLYKLLGDILAKSKDAERSIAMSSIQCEDKAFELVREAIGKGLKDKSAVRNCLGSKDMKVEHAARLLEIGIRSDEVVWVCAPARLDFAGGWTDTPPYCLECGGSVLNAAVKLNGQYPIQAIGKLYPKPMIRINSIDLGEHVIISDTSEMLSYANPGEWPSLPKAAFVAAGIIPEDTNIDLQKVLRDLGSGIDLTLFSAVPAGSGLGTSSILGSAVIACLSRMFGQEFTREDLFNRTLYMEQLMTTGGGWQDQIGGVVGGVKHIDTEPGFFQIPRISWTDLRSGPNMDLSERFLLYYTGYRRMAKNILRNIVGKYLDRDPVTLETLDGLREKSKAMKSQLDHRDINAFGKDIGEVWELNKTLDPGTSNEDIGNILDRISHLILGAKLLGAGGGGFLFMVTKGAEHTRKVTQILADKSPNERARFFDFDVDSEGLKTSVL